jgi:transposase
MARPRRKLDVLGQSEEVLIRLKKEPSGWRRERLLAVKLGLQGDKSLAEIAAAVGRARSVIQEWLESYRQRGIEGLLQKRRGRGPPSELQPHMRRELLKKLARGKARRAADVQRWLEQRCGLRVTLTSIYRYLGKCAASLKVARPSHPQRSESAARTFQQTLARRLTMLKLPAGRPVRLWVADECRLGLKPVSRRVWTLPRIKPTTPSGTSYQWSYVWGALQIGGGGREFLYTDSVCLEWAEQFLEQISRRDPYALQVVIWDGAGFHPRELSGQRPDNVRLITLPPYSPDRNPAERLWDMIKDHLCNRRWPSVEALLGKVSEALGGYWRDAGAVLRLVADPWLRAQANASSATIIPV